MPRRTYVLNMGTLSQTMPRGWLYLGHLVRNLYSLRSQKRFATSYFAKYPLLFSVSTRTPPHSHRTPSLARSHPLTLASSARPLPLSLLPRRRFLIPADPRLLPPPHLIGALLSRPCHATLASPPARFVASLPSVFRRRRALLDEKVGSFGPSRRGIAGSGGCEAGSGVCEAGRAGWPRRSWPSSTIWRVLWRKISWPSLPPPSA